MPSSKGEPTDPELREKIKEEVKNEEKGTHQESDVEPILTLCRWREGILECLEGRRDG